MHWEYACCYYSIQNQLQDRNNFVIANSIQIALVSVTAIQSSWSFGVSLLNWKQGIFYDVTDVRKSKVGYLLTESDGHGQCLYSINVRSKFCERNAKEEKVEEFYSVCLQKPFNVRAISNLVAFFKGLFFPAAYSIQIFLHFKCLTSMSRSDWWTCKWYFLVRHTE